MRRLNGAPIGQQERNISACLTRQSGDKRTQMCRNVPACTFDRLTPLGWGSPTTETVVEKGGPSAKPRGSASAKRWKDGVDGEGT